MIENYINTLSEKVKDLNLIERFGEVCQKATESKDGHSFVYGIQIDPAKVDDFGTTYTPDDRNKSVGFVYLDSYTSEPMQGVKNGVQVTIITKIQIYCTPSKLGRFNNWYGLGLELVNKLNQEGYKFTSEGKPTLEKFESIVLTEKKTLVMDCNYSFTSETQIGC